MMNIFSKQKYYFAFSYRQTVELLRIRQNYNLFQIRGPFVPLESYPMQSNHTEIETHQIFNKVI